MEEDDNEDGVGGLEEEAGEDEKVHDKALGVEQLIEEELSMTAPSPQSLRASPVKLLKKPGAVSPSKFVAQKKVELDHVRNNKLDPLQPQHLPRLKTRFKLVLKTSLDSFVVARPPHPPQPTHQVKMFHRRPPPGRPIFRIKLGEKKTSDGCSLQHEFIFPPAIES